MYNLSKNDTITMCQNNVHRFGGLKSVRKSGS